MSKAYDPKLVEEKWYSFWEKEGFFKANAHSSKKPYTIVIPPPNVTGVLHMGHALVDTLQDILIRWKRMQGFEALWVPGTDHAGIATQTVVERHLFRKTGKRRSDFPREEFIEHIWSWKEESEKQILQQLKKLGCSCDWSRLRFTLDDGCNLAVRTIFKRMYDKGLIYRGDYLVNWDPVTETALSDDEVEHEERASHLWHIRYPLEHGNGHLVVATTRPETILGDTAVAVHPDDERYRSLIGQKVRLPLTDRLIPIIGDPFVEREFGTGVVKITPAHDFNDYETGLRHDLPMINILTKDAHINEQGGRFLGLTVEEARKAVVKALKEEGLLEKIEPHTHRVGVSYRSKAVIEPFLSKQWFVRTSHFKEKLLSIVREGRVTLIPPHWQETYEHWIEHLRDWCISRQLWWGHRIPIWFDRENPDHLICYAGEGLPPEVAKHPDRYEQDHDVLDTWFSSALWPFSVLGWPNETADMKKFYPTSTLITGHDILFFWVARMILMSEIALGEVPFHETFLHGLVYGKSYWRTLSDGSVSYVSPEEKKSYDLGETLAGGVDSKWEKMSKSKGNVIDPLQIIDEYGTDALRMALSSSVTFARQIDLDLRRFEEFKNFANKIWNGSRFVLMNLEDLTSEELEQGLSDEELALEDRWILSLLARTSADLNRSLENYAFDRAATLAYEFYWNDFCALYLELTKPVLFGKAGTPEERKNKQKILAIVLLSAIRLLHPIAPFITEEIFSLLREAFPGAEVNQSADPLTKEAMAALKAPACIVAPYPMAFESHLSPEIETDFKEMFKLVYAVRNIRAEMQLAPSDKTELFLFGNCGLAKKHSSILLGLTPTTKIHFAQAESDLPKSASSALVGEIKLLIPIPESLRIKEKARLEKEREKLEKLLMGTRARLSNPEFCAKAPLEIVKNLESTVTQTEDQLAAISEKLRNF
jgi:valyl-tRNA synthetase